MSEQNKDLAEKKTGIEVDTVVFDGNGQVVGMDDDILSGVAAGLMIDQYTNVTVCQLPDTRC